ncbi:hypothetical protein [Aliarcobacter cryaerophilus]|uniref:hypothetical protein n=1 Tax=Aliarcobacter cryaerophilus TaxID=28198 RepID=UPI003DA47278
MRNLLLLLLVIGLFSGCGKNEPTLPKSYENISFTDLMKTLELKKAYSDGNSTIYESKVLDSDKYIKNNFYNYAEPVFNYCKAQGGEMINLYDFSTETFKKYIEYTNINTYYCKKDNDILFVGYKNTYHQPWQKYDRYVYYFVESDVLSNEIKNFVAKKNKDEFMKTQNEEYNLKKAENKKIKVNNKALFSQGIDNEATNNEIRKLISKITPKPYNFVWSCETVDSYKLAHTNGEGKNIVKKCTVNTDIGITFKATCTYTILSKETGYTLCEQGL